MHIPSIMSKVSLLKFHPEWVDGGPGLPGPVFRTALTEYVVAGLVREISQKLTNRELAPKLHQIGKELAIEAGRMLPAGWEDVDDICPPWQFRIPPPPPPTGEGPSPDPWRFAPDPQPWHLLGPDPSPWLEHATAAMKDIALAVAIRDLASVTTIEKVSTSLKEVGESVMKQASGRVFDEYCGTPVKPRVPAPRPKKTAA